jgi:hypothetical protein
MWRFFYMAQTTAAKNQQEAVTKIQQEVASFSQTFLNNWTNSLDKFFTSHDESDKLLLDAIENQKETFGKVTADLTKIGEEQKKLYEELYELINQNAQKVLGPVAIKPLEQLNAQLDEVNSRIQKLTETRYEEGLKLINQSQDQFQQLAKKGIEQQQKIREDVKNQIQSTQKIFFDLYEANTKVPFGLFK